MKNPHAHRFQKKQNTDAVEENYYYTYVLM